jgi:O-antigen/teichoic acid export membrane protein
MLSKNTIFTIASKFIILLANFTLVIFSTHIWGSEGRGIIALVMADVAIIVIFSNIFCGSSVAYYAPRLERDFLLLVSIAWAFLISISGAVIFSLLFGFKYFWPLFLISFIMSMASSVSSYWLGRNNIKLYNLLTILSPVGILIFLAILYFLLNRSGIEIYFHAYYLGTALVAITGLIIVQLKKSFRFPDITYKGIKSIFHYGINNEFNYFIQFLNYRLAYYFIAKMLSLSQLGVFSIAVSVTEAVWIISRSMSTIHYSNVINSDDKINSRRETKTYARQSFLISILVIIIAVLVPDSVYQLVFGREFIEVKRYIIYLSPGVMAIAVSNLYGHYFAGIGKLTILRNKSLTGLAATIILLPLLINKYQLTGVCITLNISYIASSVYLWYKFINEKEKIQKEKIR